MGLFTSTKKVSVTLADLDFPCFIGEYPFKDKVISESVVLMTNKVRKTHLAAINELMDQAKNRGFDAITHLGFETIVVAGYTQGVTGLCNGIKLEPRLL